MEMSAPRRRTGKTKKTLAQARVSCTSARPKSSSKTDKENKDLARRVKQLEKELRNQRVRNRASSRSRKPKKSTKTRASRSLSTSSSDGSGSTSRSASSSTGSDRASRSSSPKKDKKPKYDRRRQMRKGDSLKNSISLLVYLIKLLKSSHKKGKARQGSYGPLAGDGREGRIRLLQDRVPDGLR